MVKVTKRVRMLLIFGKLGLRFVLCITIILMQTHLQTTRQISICTILRAVTSGTNSAWHWPLSRARHATGRRVTTGHGHDPQVPGRSWGDRCPPHWSGTAPGAARSSPGRPERSGPAVPRAGAAQRERRSRGPLHGLPRSPRGAPGAGDGHSGGRSAPSSSSGPTGTARRTPAPPPVRRPRCAPAPRRQRLLPVTPGMFVLDLSKKAFTVWMPQRERSDIRSCRTALWLPDQINFSSVCFTYLHITFCEE